MYCYAELIFQMLTMQCFNTGEDSELENGTHRSRITSKQRRLISQYLNEQACRRYRSYSLHKKLQLFKLKSSATYCIQRRSQPENLVPLSCNFQIIIIIHFFRT